MRTKDPLADDPTLANRFLAHQLSADELELLEAQLASSEEAARELEATARFKVGLQKLQELGELDALLKPAPRQSSSRRLALAAAVILVLGAVFLTRRILLEPPILLAATMEQLYGSGNVAPLDTQTHAMFRRRATEDRLVVKLPATRAAIRLRVLPKLGMQPPFRITLVRAPDPGTPLAAVEVSAVDDEGFATVFADSQRLAVGSYLLVISGAGQPNDAGDAFPIDVVTATGK